MYIQGMGRRLFVGDLHGCREELDALLQAFAFKPGSDRLFSAGDVTGKGPDIPGTLRRLRELGAEGVIGNHDNYLLKAAHTPENERKGKQREYLALLGPDQSAWIEYLSAWPVYREFSDLILVHAGLQPGKPSLAEMDKRILLEIRTWDGKGETLNSPDDPPWFECVDVGKIVVFGHWAKRGLVDLPRFKGLDTGCVYGGKLTGWSPEENRFFQTPAKRAYVSIPGVP
jgi:diadenosine tetraphosphatase ApaH/serine/threonine PP2A family protein phosphatase